MKFYTKPPNADERLWQQAMHNNPDPKYLVPVLAVGFDDVKKRVDEQAKASAAHQAKLDVKDESLN